MTLQSIYENDRERLISRLGGVDRQTAIREVQEELDRILMTFNDQEEEEAVREAAGLMLQTARSAVSLLDTDGEAKIYGRTEYGAGESEQRKKAKQPVHFWIFLVVGILASLFSLGTAYVRMVQANAGIGQQMTVVIGILLAGGMLFLTGKSLRPDRQAEKKEKLHAETTLDPKKVAHQLLSVILTMDKKIEEIRSGLQIRKRQERTEESRHVDADELELMAQLLEDAYGRREEDEQAEEMCSQLKFYLHRKHIDVVDYEAVSGSNAGKDKNRSDRTFRSSEVSARREWFDMIPAYGGGTIRPALVMEGVLLKKGLASNG
ncbi:MAG: hypothetical protein IJW67_08050 [Blautia sp.]|nr:hypothetical protein [Blautia sp.]